MKFPRKLLIISLLACVYFLTTLHAAHAQQQQQSTPPAQSGNGSGSSSGVEGATTTVEVTSSTTTATKVDAATQPASTATKHSASKSLATLSPEKAQPVRLTLFSKPPVIDGKLDEGEWTQASVFKDFIQFRPGDNVAASMPTVAYIGYDAKYLYIAFHAYDDPSKIRATVAKRDSVFGEDNVRVYLDTFNDQRRAYVLGWNPLGIQADGIYTEGQDLDLSVDVVMESKGALTADGYVVEAAIPFKSLRYEAGKGKIWGIHLWRNIDRLNDEMDSWVPMSRDNSSTLNQAGHVTGLEGISTERTLELIPSLTVSETGTRARILSRGQIAEQRRLGLNPLDNGKLVNQPIGLDPGLTMKYSITPTVTLDLALNPDFAQVEADTTVVTANQRFPIFFPEKRPFFLEGADIFTTIISAVNTRTISDPDIAVKLTGKQGRNSFGLLLASDNAPGNYSDERRFDPELLPEQRFIDKNSYVGVLRLKRDIGADSTIGMLATTYNFIDKHNDVAGFDGHFRLNKTTTFTAQVLASLSTRFFFYPNEDASAKRTENGLVYAFSLSDDGRNWGYEYSGVGRTRFFREDVGFNRRFNTNNQSLFVRYQSTEKPKAKLINWRAYNAANTNFNWQGHSQNFNNETQLQLNFRHQSFVGGGIEEGYERLTEEEFGATREGFAAHNAANPKLTGVSVPPCLNYESDPTLSAAVRAQLSPCTFFGSDTERSVRRKTAYFFGGATPSKKYNVFLLNVFNRGVFDYDFGASESYPRVSPVALLYGPDAPLDPGAGNEWRVEASFNYKPLDTLNLSLDYNKDRLTRRDNKRVAFDDNIFSMRGTYQFSRFTFLRVRADYSTLAARLRPQVLLGWTPNPGTSFFAGYNDDLNRNGFNPFTGQLEPGLRRNGRTFFIKMSYLIRRSFGS